MWEYIIYEQAEETSNLIERSRITAEDHESAAVEYLSQPSSDTQQKNDVGKKFWVVDSDEKIGPFYLKNGEVKQEVTIGAGVTNVN